MNVETMEIWQTVGNGGTQSYGTKALGRDGKVLGAMSAGPRIIANLGKPRDAKLNRGLSFPFGRYASPAAGYFASVLCKERKEYYEKL